MKMKNGSNTKARGKMEEFRRVHVKHKTITMTYYSNFF